MAKKPLDAIELPWKMRSVDAAETRLNVHPDGRVECRVRHPVLPALTPEMLVWWFGHLDVTVEVQGQSIPAFRAWHPTDHVAVTYVAPGIDGAKAGPGARLRFESFLAADPALGVDRTVTVERLDRAGFVYVEHAAGMEVARTEARFSAAPGGVRYEDRRTVGAAGGWLRWPYNRLVRPITYPEARAQAWLRHCAEAAANLPNFLPGVWRARARPPLPVEVLGVLPRRKRRRAG